uniref:Uncharacterized protein n=1 Tax=Gossypium raimondii TaxID=29730 RepID=A0A0D2NJY9_GOSRA|nr:hypothetical protein B456_006G009200 [Gossypium raimondii]
MFFPLKSPSLNLPFLSFESKPPKSPKRSPLPLLYYPSTPKTSPNCHCWWWCAAPRTTKGGLLILNHLTT